MRILVLTPRFPHPPDRGDRLLQFRLLETLRRRHEVTLASFRDGHEPARSFAAVRDLGVDAHTVALPRALSAARVALGLAGPDPLQVCYYGSRRMERLVRRLTDPPVDAVIAYSIRMARYALLANAQRRIAFFVDSLALILRRRVAHERVWSRPMVALEARRVERFEREMARRFDRGWLVSDVDRDEFPADVRSRLRVVPNGFPAEFLDVPAVRPGRDRLLFVGHLGVPHNVDAARVLASEVLPLVREARSAAHARLVGASPSASVRRLHAPPTVTVTGFVPDLRKEYADADLLVAPLRFAAGIQNKLIEGMASALPVITTGIAARGLGARDGEELIVADDAGSTARAAIRLLESPAEAGALGARGRAFVRRRFRWEALLDALDEAFEPAAGAGASTRS